VFCDITGVPVNSVLSLDSRAEAEAFPRGDIRLGFCANCGLVYNTVFDPQRLEYSARYDPTQAFSSTFNRWHRRLAQQLVRRHDLYGKDIIEIGCGKGEFLALLCEIGANRGIGFDPAFAPDRLGTEPSPQVEFVRDFYSEKHAGRDADFVCCKMTLEHIHEAAGFVTMVRRTLGHRPGTVVFFQVPDARRILDECAFWDVYYEHCSYFSAGSLARLFAHCGFAVHRLEREFDAQYIALEARPSSVRPQLGHALEQELVQMHARVISFAERFPRHCDTWRARVRERRAAGQRVALWGSGSKGVAFVTTLGLGPEISCVVDINPHRQGKYMLGSGHCIVPPEALAKVRPDVVIVMNPIYRDEVATELSRIGLEPELWTT
jgi:SAM-dependent methyltransferase